MSRESYIIKQMTHKVAPITTKNSQVKDFVLPNVSNVAPLARIDGGPLQGFSAGFVKNDADGKITGGNAGGTENHSATTYNFTNKTLDDFSNNVEADKIHMELRNESGDTINRGDAVFISGYNVGLDIALVSLADATNLSGMPAVAILESSSLANNATGHFIQVGNLEDMNTNSWDVGDEIYISETGTTGNTLTNTIPTGTALIQKVAIVLRKHASNGVIELFGAGRVNALPNLADTKIWIGDTNGVSQQFALSGGVTMTAGGVVTVADDFLKNNAVDVAVGLTMTGDNSSADTAYVPMVLYNTDATPPAASGFPIGTLYVQYTA